VKLSKKANSSPIVSLTPLIDVVFILLIFFMLVSQFSQLQQQSLPLGQTSSSQSKQQQVIIMLRQKENSQRLSYKVNNQPMNWTQLQAYLQDNKNQAVILTPEPNITLQQFIQVKENLTNLGINKITSELIAYEVN